MEQVHETTELAPGDRDDDPVFCWRLEQLEHAGYDACTAVELAGCRDVDLHLALDLREQGCPPETAAQILR